MKGAIGQFCIKTDRYIKSQRGLCHARPIPVYKSLLRRKGEHP